MSKNICHKAFNDTHTNMGEYLKERYDFVNCDDEFKTFIEGINDTHRTVIELLISRDLRLYYTPQQDLHEAI